MITIAGLVIALKAWAKQWLAPLSAKIQTQYAVGYRRCRAWVRAHPQEIRIVILVLWSILIAGATLYSVLAFEMVREVIPHDGTFSCCLLSGPAWPLVREGVLRDLVVEDLDSLDRGSDPIP